MDFQLSPDLRALQAEAREVGSTAAATAEATEDTWMVGHDRAFSLELAKRGLAGHDLARRGRRRRAPADRAASSCSRR